MKTSLLLLLGIVTAAAIGAESSKSTSNIARKDLLSAVIAPEKSISKVEIKEVTLGAKQKVPLHLHPCPVVGVIAEGSIAFQIEGSTVNHLRSGDAFYEPANVRIARFDNEGESAAKFTAFYLAGSNDNELIQILPK